MWRMKVYRKILKTLKYDVIKEDEYFVLIQLGKYIQ